MMKIVWLWRHPQTIDYLLTTNDARFETIAYWARQNVISCVAPSADGYDWSMQRSGVPESGRFQITGIADSPEGPAFQRMLQAVAQAQPDVIVMEAHFGDPEWAAVMDATPNALHVLYYGGGPLWDLNGNIFPQSNQFDLIVVPHEKQKEWLRIHGVETAILRAWGPPRNVFRPLRTGKQFHIYYPANFSAGKRNALVAQYLEQYAPQHLPSLFTGAFQDLRMVEFVRVGGVPMNNPGPARGKPILSGRVSNNLMPYLYNLSEVLVYGSQEEGHPNAPFEAMACGTPAVVMQDCEWLVGEQLHWDVGYGKPCGLRVVPPHPEAIAAAVESLLSNYEKESRRARKFIRDHYDWWSMYHDLDQAVRNGVALKQQGKKLRDVREGL